MVSMYSQKYSVIKQSVQNAQLVVSTHRKLMLIINFPSELLKGSPWVSSLMCLFFLLSVWLCCIQSTLSQGHLILSPTFVYLVIPTYKISVVLPWSMSTRLFNSFPIKAFSFQEKVHVESVLTITTKKHTMYQATHSTAPSQRIQGKPWSKVNQSQRVTSEHRSCVQCVTMS